MVINPTNHYLESSLRDKRHTLLILTRTLNTFRTNTFTDGKLEMLRCGAADPVACSDEYSRYYQQDVWSPDTRGHRAHDRRK